MDGIDMDSTYEHTTPPGVRASDAERERTADALKRHFLDGRLTSDEYAERLDAAYAARTREQLGRLLHDLPQDREPAARPAAPSGWGAITRGPALLAALWFTLALAAAFVGGHPHGFIPIWPLLIWGFVLFRWRARARSRR